MAPRLGRIIAAARRWGTAETKAPALVPGMGELCVSRITGARGLWLRPRSGKAGSPVPSSPNPPSDLGPCDLGFEPLVGPGRAPKATYQEPPGQTDRAILVPGGPSLGAGRALARGRKGTYPARCGGRRPRADRAGAERGALRGVWRAGPTGPRAG